MQILQFFLGTIIMHDNQMAYFTSLMNLDANNFVEILLNYHDVRVHMISHLMCKGYGSIELNFVSNIH